MIAPASLTLSRASIILIACLCMSAGNSAEPATPLSLFRLINERLAYMEDVALYKAQNRIPIEDIEREQSVLLDAKQLAENLGIVPDSMESFFRAQINAAKAIQYRFRAELLTQDLPSHSINLESEIRPALDRLGLDIITLFAALLEGDVTIIEEHRALFLDSLQVRLLADTDRSTLFDAMLEVRLAQ